MYVTGRLPNQVTALHPAKKMLPSFRRASRTTIDYVWSSLDVASMYKYIPEARWTEAIALLQHESVSQSSLHICLNLIVCSQPCLLFSSTARESAQHGLRTR